MKISTWIKRKGKVTFNITHGISLINKNITESKVYFKLVAESGYRVPDTIDFSSMGFTNGSYTKATGEVSFDMVESGEKGFSITLPLDSFDPTAADWYNHTDACQESDIGKTCNITVNGQVHKVRLIGIDHDDLADGSGKAHTTWEFVNLLSDSDGNSITTFWNRGASDNSKNYDYLNSSLYKCMEGAGSGGQDTSYQGIKWYKKGETVTTTDANIAGKTVLQMLPSDLVSKLKQVTKKVGISTDSGSTYVNQTYNCKLFNLSYREMTASETSTYQSEEGTAYAYYTGTHDTNADRIKKQVNNAAAYTTTATVTDSGYSSAKNYAGYNGAAGETGNGGYLWLRSASSYDSNRAWRVGLTGDLYDLSVYNSAYAVAPAFCI